MLQNTNSSFWALLIVLSVLAYLWRRFFSLCGLPNTIPWAGADTGLLSRARATKRSFFGLRGLIQDGYYKYSKQGKTFILPNLATGPEVILPMAHMRWLLEQPDHVLNQNDVNSEFLHAERTMLHRHVIRDEVHGHVIRREMTKELDAYGDDIVDEIQHALSLNWGQTGEWQEVAVYDTMLDVIGRISNRVLVGKTLCRNQKYLRSSTTFARNVVITAGLMNLTPAMLRPLVCPLIMAYDKFHYRSILKFIAPIVKARQSQFHPGMDYKDPDYSRHNDYIQWALHDAYSHNDPAEREVEMITKRLTVLSFAAIQSSVITITNLLFDIASTPSAGTVQNTIREEVHKVVDAKSKGVWTRANLAKMTHIDSALRESMRLWGFLSRGVMKKVVAPGGITLPTGEHLSYGSKVGVTSYAIHHDEEAYPEAMKFDPFRFVDPKTPAGVAQKPQFLTTSSDNFMGFSHGRHACPGRFFAANQLKLLVAQIACNYELEPLPERPENPWLNNSIGPPIWARMRVRYRHATPRRPTALPRGVVSEVGVGIKASTRSGARFDGLDSRRYTASLGVGHEIHGGPILMDG